jgi:hypothetical protein
MVRLFEPIALSGSVENPRRIKIMLATIIETGTVIVIRSFVKDEQFGTTYFGIIRGTTHHVIYHESEIAPYYE